MKYEPELDKAARAFRSAKLQLDRAREDEHKLAPVDLDTEVGAATGNAACKQAVMEYRSEAARLRARTKTAEEIMQSAEREFRNALAQYFAEKVNQAGPDIAALHQDLQALDAVGGRLNQASATHRIGRWN